MPCPVGKAIHVSFLVVVVWWWCW